MDLRRKIGEILNRVSLINETFIIERSGKQVAAIVPISVLKSFDKEKNNIKSDKNVGKK